MDRSSLAPSAPRGIVTAGAPDDVLRVPAAHATNSRTIRPALGDTAAMQPAADIVPPDLALPDDAYAILRSRLEAIGCFQRQPGYYLRKTAITAAALGGVVALAVLAIVVNAGFLRDILRTRLPDAIVPAALLGAWALGLCWTERWRRRSVQVLVQLGTVAILAVSVAAISDVAELPERISTAGVSEGLGAVRARAIDVSRLLALPHRQDAVPPSRAAAALMPFFEYLDRCTSPSDRIIVTGEFPDVVVLAGRAFAGDGVVFGAWYSSRTHQDRSIDRLRMRSAPLAIHIDDTPQFRLQFGLVQAYLEREYELMTTIQTNGAGAIPILVQRSRVPVRTDPDTGWPCFR